MKRRLSMIVSLVALAAMLTACRGDDPMPDVFLDELHCGRAPDAEPLPLCDGAVLADAASDASMDAEMDAAVE